ncbi:MAG TPA: glycosyltransferase 87 family protein [Mycobacteriales bacterium]|nr:glycosyltransferase 87 family protein [Mycobacteriales bacterium]
MVWLPGAAGRSGGWLPGAAALAGAAGLLLWLTARKPAGFNMIDLAVYRAGGQALLDGMPLYSAHPDGSALPFTYPPFAGLLIVPLAAVGQHAAQVLLTLGSVASLAFVVSTVARRVAGPGRWLRTGGVPVLLAAALCLEPVRATLGFGQVNLLVMALVVADLAGGPRRPARGVLVGIAAAIKLTPLIFVGYLVVTGRIRAASTALGTFAGTVLVGWLLLPAESGRFWLHLVAQPERVGGVSYSGNQSLYGGLTRLLGSPAAARPAWYLAAAVVAGLGLAAAAAAARAGYEVEGVVLCGLTGVLVSPISWTHHWVWVVPGLVAALARVLDRPPGRRLVPAAALAGATLLFALSPVWWPPAGGDAEYRHSTVERLAADSYLLAGIACLAVVAVALAFRARPPAASTTAGSCWTGPPPVSASSSSIAR